MKTCSKCKVPQPEENFQRNSAMKDGLQNECKPCRKLRDAQYKETHPEKVRAKAAAYFQKNKERIRLREVERYNKNPEKFRERKRVSARRYCQKNPNHHRKSLYGLSREEEAALRLKQDGRCLGCSQPFTAVKEVVDHDHITDKVRGLLCRHCNWCLGHAKDNPKILRALAVYLEAHGK